MTTMCHTMAIKHNDVMFVPFSRKKCENLWIFVELGHEDSGNGNTIVFHLKNSGNANPTFLSSPPCIPKIPSKV